MLRIARFWLSSAIESKQSTSDQSYKLKTEKRKTEIFCTWQSIHLKNLESEKRGSLPLSLSQRMFILSYVLLRSCFATASCCWGENCSSWQTGHLSILMSRKISPSNSKSTSISNNSTQHVGQISAPAFTVWEGLFSFLFGTSYRYPKRLWC